MNAFPSITFPSIAFPSIAATWQGLSRGWNWFFHQPGDARICAAIRISYATLVLIHFAALYPDLTLWYSGEGVLPAELAREIRSTHAWTLFDRFPDTPQAVHIAFWIAVGHAVALLMGLLPRFNALLLLVWLISFQGRNSVINDGEDTLMRLLAFFLIWLPSGQCWSVNALLRRWWQQREGAVGAAEQDVHVPGWPLRLLQVEMAALFFSSGVTKLAGDAWLNGTAMYYVSRLDDFFGRFPVPSWMFDTPWVVAVITWSVLVAEVCIPVFVWFRETRLPCLVIAVVFHLANEWTMNLFLFHWLMIVGWLAFLTPADFLRMRRMFLGRPPTHHTSPQREQGIYGI